MFLCWRCRLAGPTSRLPSSCVSAGITLCWAFMQVLAVGTSVLTAWRELLGCFETGYLQVQADLKLTVQLRLSLNLSSCLHFPNTGITGTCCDTQGSVHA